MQRVKLHPAANLKLLLPFAFFLCLLGWVTEVRADYLDGVQGELNLLYLGEGFTVAKSPAAALIAATSTAIADDFSPSPDAFNYVAAVLAARADRVKIAFALVHDAVLTIGGAAADPGDTARIAGAAASVTGMTDAGRAAVATAALTANPPATGDIITAIGPAVLDKTVFAKSGVTTLASDTVAITAFVKLVAGTGVPSTSAGDRGNFTLAVAAASARNPVTVAAIVAGGASSFSNDADRQSLAALAISKIPAAAVNISAAIGPLISDQAACAVTLAANRTATLKGLITQGLVDSTPSAASAIIAAVLNADAAAARPAITAALRPSFAASAAAGVLGDLASVTAIASAVASGRSDLEKGLIASAVAARVPAGAGQIALAIITNTDISNKAAFAVAIARTAAVFKVPAQVANVAKTVAGTTATEDDKIAIAVAVISATRLTTPVAESVSQLVTGADAETLGTAQAAFAGKLAAQLPTLSAAIAVGIAMNNPLFAGDVAAQIVKSSPTALRFTATIAAALAKALPDNAVDVAVELGGLINNGTVPLAYAPLIATALASAPGVKGDLTYQRLGALAFDLVALIPSPATTSNTNILLQVIANIVRQNVSAGPLIAGAAAEAAVDYFTGLAATQRDSLLTQIENTVKKFTPASLDDAVTNNVDAVRHHQPGFQLGGLAPHESPFAPN